AGELDLRAGLAGSDVVSELARSFDALADANTQHLETQRELLHAISHELRTPVARLRFALAGLVAADEPHRASWRERAEANIDELHMLLDEVLAYVRAGPTGAPQQFVGFALEPLLRSIADEHPEANIVIDAPRAARMTGNPTLIRRAVSNVVRNAVHYARDVVRVTVRAGDPVVLTVLDDGPGLPEEADDRLFLPFVRYDRRPDGHGLGTSIASAVARRHGGTLDFSRRPPESGAEFVFRLPRGPDA
ncbi:MAG: ATP-binding protein, partial [Myxococcota bacterium]